jgi:DNA-binding transcriptional LysR family regulator
MAFDWLGSFRVFARVVEKESFSAAARDLHTSQPTVSKSIAALEEALGARLLNRTTRRLALTEEGRTVYAQALGALDSVEAVRNAVGKRRAAPAGLVRIGTPVSFGRLQVAPRVPALLARHPELQVELNLSDAAVDLVENAIDLAIRIGEVADTSLVARRVGTTRRVTVASKGYFRKHGRPKSPFDLARHDCIVYTRLATGNEWHFASPTGNAIAVKVSGRYRVDNSEAVREGALAGAGVAVVPVWLFTDEIERGLVQVVLQDFEPQPLPIHLVYPSRRLLAPRTRAAIDYFAEAFAREPKIAPAAA